MLFLAGTLVYQALSRQIDDRLGAGWAPVSTRLFAAALELSPGLALNREALVVWLNDLGYTQRDQARGAGEFAVDSHAVTLIEKEGPQHGRTLRVVFGTDTGDAERVSAVEVPPGGYSERLRLGAPLLSTLEAGARRKRRFVPLSRIPQRVIQAVLSAEDHRFFEHRGVDAVRIAGAALTNVSGHRRYLVGASTLTQQLIKNTLLRPEQTISRKLREQALALLLERRLSKERILELYLNEVYLGPKTSASRDGSSGSGIAYRVACRGGRSSSVARLSGARVVVEPGFADTSPGGSSSGRSMGSSRVYVCLTQAGVAAIVGSPRGSVGPSGCS